MLIYSHRVATNGAPTTDVGQTVTRVDRHAHRQTRSRTSQTKGQRNREPVRLGERETEKQQQPNYDIQGATQQSSESHHTMNVAMNITYILFSSDVILSITI